MMNMTKAKIAALILMSSFAFSAFAADEAATPAASEASPAAEPPAAPLSMGTEYTDTGADTCLMCHAEDGKYPVYQIFKTKHANRADKRAPFAVGNLQCEACHGPGKKHADGGGGPDGINNQTSTSFLTPQQRNKYCLECHQNRARLDWIGSKHDSNNLACADCHTIHAGRDPVREKATQPEVCYKCHKQQRADFAKPSAHPVRYGKLACSDCHNPHGTNATALLVKPTVNQTCYTCHAEKRGPFLWEHSPVAEDCTLCHSPHGTVRPTLLKKTPPLLCQQCHSVDGHPSLARTSTSLPGGSGGGSAFLLAGSCTNCHSQIHGSNHPSGVKLMR